MKDKIVTAKQLAVRRRRVASLAKEIAKQSTIPSKLLRAERAESLAKAIVLYSVWSDLALAGELDGELRKKLVGLWSNITRQYTLLGIPMKAAAKKASFLQ